MPGTEAQVLALLTGSDATQILDLALGTVGARLATHTVHSVEHRPGDGVTVGYRVWTDVGGGAEEYLLVSSTAGHDVPADAPALARIDGPGGRLIAWRHPDDPALPGLGAACDPVAVADVLPGQGAVTALELIGYRALRRAVLRVVRGGDTHWVKVLRPGAGRGGAPDVVHRLGLLRAAGLPVPAVTATREDGLVVLAALAGVPLLDAVAADGAAGLDLDDLTELLDRLPPDVAGLAPRPSWSARAGRYADAVGAGPAGSLEGSRARSVAEAVRSRSARLDLGPVVPTHGDLHAGQLTVAPGHTGWRVVGLLDVDTVGPGHRVDDLACLLAHAVALGPVGAGLVARWEAQARRHVDPATLAVRTAGVLLSLAAGAAHGRGPATVGTLLDEAESRLGTRT